MKAWLRHLAGDPRRRPADRRDLRGAARIPPSATQRTSAPRWRHPRPLAGVLLRLDDPVLLHPDLLRPARHDLRRPHGLLRPGRLRLVLRLCAVAQSWFRRDVGRRGALPAVRALGPDAAADRQDGRVLQPDLRARRHGAWRRDPAVVEPRSRIPFFGEHLPLPAIYGRRRACCGQSSSATSRCRAWCGRRSPVRPRIQPAGLAHGDRAGAAGHRRRRDHRDDLLRAAAAGAAA